MIFVKLLTNLYYKINLYWLNNFSQRWSSFCLFKKHFFTFLLYISLLAISVVIAFKYADPVYCEDFMSRQHSNNTEIIKDIILNTSEKELLISLNKCLKAKVSLLTEQVDVTINDSSSLTPLITNPKNFSDSFRRFLFWLFCVFFAIFFDGLITFGYFIFDDVAFLKEHNLYLLEKLQHNPELVRDLFDLLVKLEII